jgi:N-acetylglutamate synthase-like GNAT family acetyltransferase
MTDATAVGDVTFRRGTPEDIPRFVELIAAENLPPLFIAEFIDGFVAAEHDDAVIACGGVELYEDCAVIRSVVVDPSGRGLGRGAALAERLEADARTAGATDIYLFTGEALAFWKHRRYVEVPFEAWKRPPQLCWQYQFVTQNLELVGDAHSMWRKA